MQSFTTQTTTTAAARVTDYPFFCIMNFHPCSTFARSFAMSSGRSRRFSCVFHFLFSSFTLSFCIILTSPHLLQMPDSDIQFDICPLHDQFCFLIAYLIRLFSSGWRLLCGRYSSRFNFPCFWLEGKQAAKEENLLTFESYALTWRSMKERMISELVDPKKEAIKGRKANLSDESDFMHKE